MATFSGSTHHFTIIENTEHMDKRFRLRQGKSSEEYSRHLSLQKFMPEVQYPASDNAKDAEKKRERKTLF
jgi:hypothetical protein